MAQASPVQAEVQRTTLRDSAARQQMANPVEIRRGEIRSVTLTIPLLSDRNSYLVVQLPNAVVQDLLRQAREVPDTERPAFVRDWIMRNQQAVLEQFVRSGRSERRFRYDVVPVPTRMGEVTPRRVEAQSEHRLIEEYRQVSRTGQDIVPAGGWRRPREGELPQAIRERSNNYHLGRIPLGDGVVEEYQGRRYYYLKCWHPPDQRNRQRHHGVSVFVQETVIQQTSLSRPEVQGSRTVVPPRVETREIALQPTAQPRREREERELRGGDGTRAHPFEVTVARDRARGEGIGATEIDFPMTIVGHRFRFSFTLNQLSNSKIAQTYQEVIRIARSAIQSVETGARVQITQNLPGFRESITQSFRSHPELLRYAETH